MTAGVGAAIIAIAFVRLVIRIRRLVDSWSAPESPFKNPLPPEPRHFNSRTKDCYQYGCTDDCPVKLSEQLPRATIHREGRA